MPAINLGYLLGQATNAATGYRQGQREQQEANRQAQIDDANRLFAEWAKRQQLDLDRQQLNATQSAKQASLQNALDIANLRASSQKEIQGIRDEAAAERQKYNLGNRPIQIDNQGRAWVLDATTGQMRQVEGDARFPVPGQGGGAGSQPKPRPVPSGIAQAHATNRKQISVVDEAIKAVQANPAAVGMKAYTPGMILDRMDTKGVPARAAISDIGSLEIRDRSGAAVTAAEFPRLRPFIPQATDNAETVLFKLQRMKQIIEEETGYLEEAFSPAYGYIGLPPSKPPQQTSRPSVSEFLGRKPPE